MAADADEDASQNRPQASSSEDSVTSPALEHSYGVIASDTTQAAPLSLYGDSWPPGLPSNGHGSLLTSYGEVSGAIPIATSRYGGGDDLQTSALTGSSSGTPGHHALSDTQRLAQQFHVRHGDPGSSAGGGSFNETGAGSELAGIYEEDLGGKAFASRAWAARQTNGSQYQWDDSLGMEDERVDNLFDEEDIAYTEQPKSRGRPRKGRGGWRKLLKGTEHAEVGRAKAAARGRPRGARGRPRGQRGRGKIVDPGREFKAFLTEANKAYLAGDIDLASDKAKQAIHANPEVYQAHALMSTIFEVTGRFEEAIQSLKHGAVVARNPQVWIQVADKVLERGGGRRDRNTLREAVDCYSEGLKLTTALKYDPDTELALRDRALHLLEELNDVKGCRIQLRHILKASPAKTQYVLRYAMLCFQWNDTAEMTKAKECYEEAFELYKDKDYFGNEPDPAAEDDEEDDGSQKRGFDWTHLNVYLELVDTVGDPNQGITAGKRLARWFLGRKEETFWDNITNDDREFDNDHARRNCVVEFQQGRASRDLLQYGDGLPIDIRVMFGMFRMKMRRQDEALRHFMPLLEYAKEDADFVEEYYEAFSNVGDALQDAGNLKDAAQFYDIARTKRGADDADFGLGEKRWMRIGRCYQILGRLEEAMAGYENVRLRRGHLYTLATARLAKLHEDVGNLERTRWLCHDLITFNRRDLIQEMQIKMINELPKPRNTQPLPPESLRPLPPAKPVPTMPFPPPRALPQLLARPSPGMLAEQNTTAGAFGTLGPLSRPIIVPPEPQQHTDNGTVKKGRGKKRGLLSTVDHDADEAAADESSAKRPRLKRKYVRKTTIGSDPARKDPLQDVQTKIHEYYAIVQALWGEMLRANNPDATEAWTEAAHAMLDEFQAMKVFFPDRDQNVQLRVVENSAKPFLRDFTGSNTLGATPTQFLKISFAEWQHIFVDLALLYVRTGEQDRCYRVVQEVLCSANVFYLDHELNQISFATGIHVGLAFNDSQYLIQLARQFIANKPLDFRNSEGFQLFAAVARFSFGSNWFIAGPTQKFMLRMVKQSDFMSMTDEVRKKVDWSAQGPGLSQRAANYPKEDMPDAHILTMYGHMVAAANHSFSALPYYYRALALQPENICVNLSIATMWIQFSMKRQVDNRQEGITNGLSFLYRYYDLRVKSGKAGHIQEAEYNVARMWHYLGLTHLAVPAYEKVLKLSKDVQAEKIMQGLRLDHEVEDYAQEAAYALQNIYGLVGNDEAARAITEEWLVI